MKIPLRVRKRFGQPMPFVFIIVRAPHVKPVPIDVLVDTGSPWMAIAPGDSQRLRIPVSSLEKAEEYQIVQLAGYKFRRLLLKRATIHLRGEQGKLVKVDMQSVTVLQPVGKPSSYIKQIPSVLGSDFLVAGRFALHFDPANRTAYLNKQL